MIEVFLALVLGASLGVSGLLYQKCSHMDAVQCNVNTQIEKLGAVQADILERLLRIESRMSITEHSLMDELQKKGFMSGIIDDSMYG